MDKTEEVVTEYIGSKVGTVMLKVKKTKSGIKTKADATGFELLQIAAMLIDMVAVDTQTEHDEALGAVIELLQGDK